MRKKIDSFAKESEMEEVKGTKALANDTGDPVVRRLSAFQDRIERARSEKKQKDRLRSIGKALGSLMIAAFIFAFIFGVISPDIALAAGAEGSSGAAGGTITSGFTNLLDIVKSLVSSIGTIVLLWGFFEWGTSMQSQDGVMQSSAFKRIGGGLVMVLAPQLISVFI